MQREVKYRGQRLGSKDWIFGYYASDGERSWILNPVNLSGVQSFNWTEIIPESVSQFIGLPDENGKDIYEDDIVTQWHEVLGTFTGRVVFIKGAFCLRLSHKNQEYVPIYERVCVQGNIHEHPAMLAALTS